MITTTPTTTTTAFSLVAAGLYVYHNEVPPTTTEGLQGYKQLCNIFNSEGSGSGGSSGTGTGSGGNEIKNPLRNTTNTDNNDTTTKANVDDQL